MRYQFVVWLERKTAERGGVPTEAQLQLLQKTRSQLVYPTQQIEAPHPDYLDCRHTRSVGTVKGVGKIYQ